MHPLNHCARSTMLVDQIPHRSQYDMKWKLAFPKMNGRMREGEASPLCMRRAAVSRTGFLE